MLQPHTRLTPPGDGGAGLSITTRGESGASSHEGVADGNPSRHAAEAAAWVRYVQRVRRELALDDDGMAAVVAWALGDTTPRPLASLTPVELVRVAMWLHDVRVGTVELDALTFGYHLAAMLDQLDAPYTAALDAAEAVTGRRSVLAVRAEDRAAVWRLVDAASGVRVAA